MEKLKRLKKNAYTVYNDHRKFLPELKRIDKIKAFQINASPLYF